MYNFALNQLFAAKKGAGATMNGDPIHVSQCTGMVLILRPWPSFWVQATQLGRCQRTGKVDEMVVYSKETSDIRLRFLHLRHPLELNQAMILTDLGYSRNPNVLKPKTDAIFNLCVEPNPVHRLVVPHAWFVSEHSFICLGGRTYPLLYLPHSIHK